MNFFIFSALINAFIAGLLGIIVFLKNKKELTNQLFLGLSLSVIFWSLGYWQWLSAISEATALFWIRVFSISSLFIPVFYFHWILVFTGIDKQKRNSIKFLYLIVFIFFVFSFSSLFVNKVESKLFFSYWPTPGILYTLYLIFIYLGLTIYSLFILWKQYQINIEPKKSSIKYIILGSLIGFGGGATNFFLWYDIPIPPYGNILVSLYPIVLAIASFRYGLFNIKVIATELLTFAIWAAVLIEVFLADTWRESIFEIGLLIFVVFFGILIIRSVLKEVRHREEMEKLANELEFTNQKLKETDKIRAEMYSFVSHQIKAPIGIIKGFAQLLCDGSYGKIPKKAKETTIYIKTACDRLINLTEMFLNLRRIEEGKMDYEFKEINLIDLAESVFKELKLLADQKNLEFKFECGEKEIKVKVDEQRMRQVFQNLIENSIKYTKQGFVKVNLRLTTNDRQPITDNQQQSVLFTVSDSGLGIKKEVLSEIFEQFKRAKETRQIQGTGLGLYVAREIVKAHGGEIWAESEGENKGSIFYVKLSINDGKQTQ